MRKIYKVVSLFLICGFLSFSFSGCYGNFSLTKKLYSWNGSVGNKFVNTIVMWVLFILPVYEIAGAVDFAILNLIEFWTGKNPMAMNENETETQFVKSGGKDYEITATKNRFDIKDLSTTKIVSLTYDENTLSWYINNNDGTEIKVAQLDADNLNILHLIHPDGELINVDLHANKILAE
jgi:hypothetical protein